MRRFIAVTAVITLVGSLAAVAGGVAAVSSTDGSGSARVTGTFAADSADGAGSESVLHVAGARVARGVGAFILPDAATAHVPENDHARGMVFDGLRPGPTGTPCDGSFEIRLGNDEVLCTHGPDPAPPGVDVRVPVEVHEDQAGDGTTAGDGGIACIGNGTDGNRVQAVYAVASDRPDRFADVAPLISSWAGEVERVFAEGAARVGGERHVRFVTKADCSLDVIRVEVSAAGDDTIHNTIDELWDLGYDSPDRKYLIWMDANVYCGVAPIYPDDSAGQSNLNNGGVAMYARVDSGCWNQSSSVAAHELVHAMGGVQPSAPHGTDGFHCFDEWDRMCYQDSVNVVLVEDCPRSDEANLDCNNDDYYHPDPAAGSYLADHWNVADSSFLHSGPVGSEPPPPPPPPPPPVNEAPVVDAGPDAATEVAVPVTLAGTVGDDGLPGESLSVEWTTIEGPGSATLGDTASAATTATFELAGTYVLQLTAHDGELTSSDTTTVTVSEPPPPPPPDPDPIETTEVYSSSWNRKNPSRSYDVRADAGMFRATLVASSGSGGRGKKGRAPAPSPEVSITVTDQYGKVVEATSGAAPLTLSTDVLSGNYVVTVHGSAKTSFELTVTYMAP